MAAKHHKKRKKIKKALQKITIVPTEEKLTAAAGLGTLMELFDSSDLKDEFIECLPTRVSHRSIGSYQLALTLMASFLYGNDCLKDLDYFRGEHKLKALFGTDTAAARTHGDYLRDFEMEHIVKLNKFLNRMSRFIFASLKEQLPDQFKPRKMIIDMDSTDHVQHGDKMEGLAWNFKNNWCLDTQVAFNQLGFCHGFQLRPGNTKSGVDAEPLVFQCFDDGKTQAERKWEFKDFFRADSAYCKQDVIRALLNLGVHFTLTAHDGTTKWKEQMEQEGLSWQPWVYSKEEIEKAEEKEKELPKIEVSRFYWSPGWSEEYGKKLVFPILVKRTWNKEREEEGRKKYAQGSLFHPDGFMTADPWDYYAIVTNIPLDLAPEKAIEQKSDVKFQRWSIQKVFEFHNKRGNSENFIKEEKYGYDLKHFPCQKLLANYAFGLLAQVAHNILRWVAIVTHPERPHFSKKLRKRFVFIPGKIIRHSGYTILKMAKQSYKEVMKLRETWGLQSGKIPPYYSSA